MLMMRQRLLMSGAASADDALRWRCRYAPLRQRLFSQRRSPLRPLPLRFATPSHCLLRRATYEPRFRAITMLLDAAMRG